VKQKPRPTTKSEITDKNAPGKLRLRSEALRPLSNTELDHAHGGMQGASRRACGTILPPEATIS